MLGLLPQNQAAQHGTWSAQGQPPFLREDVGAGQRLGDRVVHFPGSQNLLLTWLQVKTFMNSVYCHNVQKGTALCRLKEWSGVQHVEAGGSFWNHRMS